MLFYYELVVFVLGLIIGSFLNCLIWRYYKDEDLGGRSYCPACHHQIAWYDNIPLLSFIILRGRCRHCRGRISWQYPLVELATAVFFVLVFRLDWLQPNFDWRLLRDFLAVVTLIFVFVYDYRWQLIPTEFVALSGGAIFILNIFLGVYWFNLILFALIGAVFFLIQYLVTHRKGIGEGDIWLGAWLGVLFPEGATLLLVMFIAYCLGAIVGLTLMSRRRKTWKSALPFGPFLATAAIIALIWARPLIYWYLGLWP